MVIINSMDKYRHFTFEDLEDKKIFVPLEEGSLYEPKVYMKTEDFTTQGGIIINAIGFNCENKKMLLTDLVIPLDTALEIERSVTGMIER